MPVTQPVLWAVIPAAGSGSRFGGPVAKQHLPLLGQTVFYHTLHALLGHLPVAGVVIPASLDDPCWTQTLAGFNASIRQKLQFVPGGNERASSVLAGLQHLQIHARPDDWVLVHDAARPCVHPDSLHALWDYVRQHDQGAILAVPVKDTLKQVDEKTQNICKTVPRTTLWQAQTPQIFKYGALLAALQLAATNKDITDEASAMEQAGIMAAVVCGRHDNLKITYPEDLLLAQHILMGRQPQETAYEA